MHTAKLIKDHNSVLKGQTGTWLGYASSLGIDGSHKVLLNTCKLLKRINAETIIALFALSVI
jgi:hypothetical protein